MQSTCTHKGHLAVSCPLFQELMERGLARCLSLVDRLVSVGSQSKEPKIDACAIKVEL